MDREQIIEVVSSKLKLIRIEKGYTQERMADTIGVSKKTLIEIEKGRIPAGWTNTIAICALFRDSETLQASIGGDPLEIVETLAHSSVLRAKEKTMGGRIWWKELEKRGSFRLQQNLISNHYRILDSDDYRWYSSFDHNEALELLEELSHGSQHS